MGGDARREDSEHAASQRCHQGGCRARPHRSLLKADGITDEEMGRPLIAVVNSRNDIIPGHNNLDKICEAVKAGIYLAGGVPFEVSTIGVCDGIAMNHAGMHYSLVSREVIADSLECAVEGHAFDGIVCIPNCDKDRPWHDFGRPSREHPHCVRLRRPDASRPRFPTVRAALRPT